jgi:hypothetical protein
MKSSGPAAERSTRRRVFAAWSIEIPATFDETFVGPDGYWHAWDEHRSVSLTSVVLTEAQRPVDAQRILRELPPLDGDPIDELPRGLVGRAASCGAPEPARASRLVAGMLAMDGRLLVATITADDHSWCRRTWLSIRGHDAPMPPASRTRASDRRAGCH